MLRCWVLPESPAILDADALDADDYRLDRSLNLAAMIYDNPH